MSIFLFLVLRNILCRIVLYSPDYQSYSYRILFDSGHRDASSFYMGSCGNQSNTWFCFLPSKHMF